MEKVEISTGERFVVMGFYHDVHAWFLPSIITVVPNLIAQVTAIVCNDVTVQYREDVVILGDTTD